MTLFLDNCCLNRPGDDLNQPRNKQEAEAVQEILRLVASGGHVLLGSSYLIVEARRNPNQRRQQEVLGTLRRLARIVRVSEPIESRARYLESLGARTYDALHLAAAEAGGADCFLTTDDRLLNFSIRNATILTVRVLNPLAWLNAQHP